MMRNNQVLQRLGVTALASIVNNTFQKSKGSGPKDSGSLYDPRENEDSEQEEVDKVSKDLPNKSSKQNGSMSVGGARASKRVVAPEQQEKPTRVTRQKTRELTSTEEVFHGTSPDPQEVPTISLSTTTHDALVSANSPTQHEDQIQMSDEGAPTASTQQGQRGRRMWKDLDRISRGLCSKIAIHISKGKRQPEAPMQAAKLASEGGIILWQHIPILPHWKEYKKNESHLTNYIGKVAGQFTIDTNSKAVRNACADMLKGGQRHMRYWLKNQCFNGVPANEMRTTSHAKCMTDAQWRELVEMWSISKHKQRTGSRCYIAQAHVVKQDKYKDVEPTVIDLFKDCHCSKNIGLVSQ